MAITLALAKQHLEYDADDRDDLIQSYVDAAAQQIADFTGLDVTGDDDAAVLDQAQLLLIGHWFANREASGGSMSEIPFAVHSLLANRRLYSF